jgi:hypothetical protein
MDGDTMTSCLISLNLKIIEILTWPKHERRTPYRAPLAAAFIEGGIEFGTHLFFLRDNLFFLFET